MNSEGERDVIQVLIIPYIYHILCIMYVFDLTYIYHNLCFMYAFDLIIIIITPPYDIL